MRHPHLVGLLLMFAGMLGGCGVPREAGQLASAAAAVDAAVGSDDAAVRQRLSTEAADWSHLAALLQQRQLGGITGIDSSFVRLVSNTASLAQRQQALIAQQADRPDTNRQALDEFKSLWHSADLYLNP